MKILEHNLCQYKNLYRDCLKIFNECVVPHINTGVNEFVHQLIADGKPVVLRFRHGAGGVNHVGHVLDEALRTNVRG